MKNLIYELLFFKNLELKKQKKNKTFYITQTNERCLTIN
jgi:hypothetical protein